MERRNSTLLFLDNLYVLSLKYLNGLLLVNSSLIPVDLHFILILISYRVPKCDVTKILFLEYFNFDLKF